MAPNDTIVDEPVTPAPLFAYRALKGILFGSPESPRDGDDSNKENAPLDDSDAPKKPATTKKSATGEKSGASNNKVTTSENTKPTKEVQSSENSDNMTIVFTTPKPKRWEGGLLGPNLPPAQGSPTRGILRVPGQATPRAQSLRDVNVTFKGLSPEEATAVRQSRSLNDLPAPGTAQPPFLAVAMENGKPAGGIFTIGTAPAAATTGSAKAQTQDPATTNIAASTSQAPASGISAEAFKAYQQRTEKEMKRLIGHAQKMKDYAYQADLQNHELRKIIAQLQKENENLRISNSALTDSIYKTTDKILGPQQYGVHRLAPDTRYDDILGPMTPPRAPRATHAPVHNEVNPIDALVARNRVRDRAPLIAPPLPKGTKKDSAIARYYAGMDNFLSGDPSRGGVPPCASARQIADAWASREADVDMEGLLAEAEAIANAPEDSEFKKAITHPKVYAANKLRAAEAARNERMPPERSAAARERLAKKSEARKASLEM